MVMALSNSGCSVHNLPCSFTTSPSRVYTESIISIGTVVTIARTSPSRVFSESIRYVGIAVTIARAQFSGCPKQ